MSPADAPTVLLDGLLFPEGPRWHERRPWFSDTQQHRVMTVDLDGNPAVAAECSSAPPVWASSTTAAPSSSTCWAGA